MSHKEMSEIEKYQDRIDEYIRGTMSASDKIIFEGELRQNAELRQEVEVQASISDAVQAVQLKRLLRQIESDMSSIQEEKTPTAAIDGDGRRVVIAYPNVFKRQFLYWASAAAAVALLFFAGNSWRQSSRIRGFGNEYYASLIEPVARDGNELDILLVSSYTLIGAGEYDAAMADLNEARQLISTGLAQPIVDEETEYEHKVLEEKQYEVDWYDSIILMKQGKYRKAKDALKLIAQSLSPYADNAKDILNQMFNIKP